MGDDAGAANTVRVTGVQVPSTRSKHPFERRLTVSTHFGPWVWREVQAHLMPTVTEPNAIRELELARPDGRYVISIGLLNPTPNAHRVNMRVAFATGSWVCGDAFLLAKEYQEPHWLTRSFTMEDWEQLNALLKSVATPQTPFLDAELCTPLAVPSASHRAQRWATRAPRTRTARRRRSHSRRDAAPRRLAEPHADSPICT